MTNKEKALEIATDNIGNEQGYINLARYSGAMEMARYSGAMEMARYSGAMEMAQWKDEQHKQEKQQWIENVVKWINDNYFEYLQPISYYEQLKDSIDINDFVNDIKKAMEE